MRVCSNCVVALFCATMLMLGCGNERKADEVVESFLDSCLVDNAIKDLTFSDLDSTTHLNDSVIASLRASTEGSAMFKKNLKYGERNKKRPLHFITATYYTSSGDHVKQTFYLDEHHLAVVCVKNGYIAK